MQGWKNRSIKATLILAALFGLGCSSQPVSIQPTDSRSPYFSALSRSPAILAAAPIGTTLDANGNTIQDVSSTYNVSYDYDVNGRLIHQTVQVVSTSVSYETRSVYDADGNKIGFYDLDKTYTYVNSQVRTVERSGSAPKALLAYEDCETTETGTLNCFAKDHLGSVVGVFEVTSAGASTWKQVKDTLPFGQDLIHYETADFTNGIDYGFNGNRKEGIAALNQDLIDYAARHLKAVTGRFLQADTVTPDNGQSILNFNRYAYARNNPVNRIDPNGHEDRQSLTPLGDELTRANQGLIEQKRYGQLFFNQLLWRPVTAALDLMNDAMQIPLDGEGHTVGDAVMAMGPNPEALFNAGAGTARMVSAVSKETPLAKAAEGIAETRSAAASAGTETAASVPVRFRYGTEFHETSMSASTPQARSSSVSGLNGVHPDTGLHTAWFSDDANAAKQWGTDRLARVNEAPELADQYTHLIQTTAGELHAAGGRCTAYWIGNQVRGMTVYEWTFPSSAPLPGLRTPLVP